MFNRVLICEDEPLLRDLIASHLCLNGFVVSEAQDGVECVRLIERQIPDAIILDINMPSMGGLGVLRKLRDMEVDCPIFVITGSTDIEKITEAKSLGVVEVLAKPFNVKNIAVEIRKHLRH